ncbi:MAG: HAD family hydrolase [Halobacteriales archaeon]
MPYDAILFDNDGVITRPVTKDILEEAAWEAFEAAGVSDPQASHVEGIIRGVDPDWLKDVCAEYGIELEEFWRLRDHYSSAVQRAAIENGHKGLYDDVEVVHSLRHRLGIVSSNQQTTIDFIIDYFDLEETFETYYGREPTVESLRRKKPAPHYVTAALSDLDAESALFVGDSDSDVHAAANAGIDSAYIRRPHRDDDYLTADPSYVLDSLWELRTLTDVETSE